MTNDNYHQDDHLPFETEPDAFPSKEEKEVYRQRLAEYLKDPEFRKIEGFPIGTDEAILALSDPPYYTACPNPFLPEIIEQWQQERAEIREALGLKDEKYWREPFAADVSEGKNDPIYNAHSYHTKVPHKAIMRYILHYTDPGDIVFDGFCGTGMTGVAAQLCGDKKTVESLGYRVDEQGVIWEGGKAISRVGARKAVLNDLSPAATFIAYNYNTPVDVRTFEKEAKRILREVEEECGWMYETWHPNCDDPNRVKAKINYTVWSDVFRCPHCGQEMVFWDVAVDKTANMIKNTWACPSCGSLLAKAPSKGSSALRVERVMDTVYDRALSETIRQARQVPVMINYSAGKKRYEKGPDKDDFELLRKIEETTIPYPFPTNELPKGFNTLQPKVSHGLTHVHHFYTKRNLRFLATIFTKSESIRDLQIRLRMMIIIQSISSSLVSKLAHYNLGKRGNGPVPGTLYVASLISEANSLHVFSRKQSDFLINQKSMSNNNCVIQSTSSSNSPNSPNTIDYFFVDPPFGNNIMYSELNFIWEAWLGVITNNGQEAIINKEQKKGLAEYQELMKGCLEKFQQYLKPGHWITIEFHNSQNSIWNAIHEAILHAGFIIADVRTLDKQQATYHQVTTSAAVKQDLVISAYKPTAEFEQRFSIEGGTAQGAWEFVRQHLEQLPMPVVTDGKMSMQGERTPYVLYDRMLAFHLVRGLSIPLSASEFYAGLTDRWLYRNGMVFTSAQAQQFDQMRLQADKVEQLSLFVTDETSAVQWLKSELSPESGHGPQTYAELQPAFLRKLHQERYEALPELKTLLEQNFLKGDDDRWYTPALNQEADLQALRERDLLRDFEDYSRGSGKVKVFRSEAIKAGFSKAWKEHNYGLIVQVAERLPEQALQEDPQLKLYYDNALNRARNQPEQMRLL